jgi:hypothetical protein
MTICSHKSPHLFPHFHQFSSLLDSQIVIFHNLLWHSNTQVLDKVSSPHDSHIKLNISVALFFNFTQDFMLICCSIFYQEWSQVKNIAYKKLLLDTISMCHSYHLACNWKKFQWQLIHIYFGDQWIKSVTEHWKVEQKRYKIKIAQSYCHSYTSIQ